MSDQDPTRPIDPTQGAGATPGPAQEPTTAMPPATGSSTVYETTAPAEPPRQPPSSGGVSPGLAVAAAVLTALLGLLAGYLVWGGDDDGDDTAAPVDTVPADPEADDALVAERDQLAQQVQDQQGQLDDLQTQVDDLTTERDDLQSELDDAAGDEVTTTPAPDVVDGTLDDAEDVAGDNGWTLVERLVPADGEEPGTVVAQYPSAGTDMIDGSVLVVDVAEEPADAGED